MPPRSVDDTVSRLSLWCRHTPRGLAFVEFHDEAVRQRMIDALRTGLPEEAGPWHEITLGPAPRAIEVVDQLVAGLEAWGRGVVSVDGFGVLFEPGDGSADLVSALNFNRERLAAPPLRQIWWLPPHVAQALLHGAPDLYSWFQGRWRLAEIGRPSEGRAEWEPAWASAGILGTELLPERLDDARRRAGYLAGRFERAVAEGGMALEVLEEQLLRPAVRALREAGAEREAQELEADLRQAANRDLAHTSHDKPPLTGGTYRLPFGQLSPLRFEELCLWLVRREGYERAEHLGESGSERGRDIVAWKDGQRFAFQCKRVAKFGAASAQKEIRKIRGLPPAEQPEELVFVVTAAVSAETRRQARLTWGDEATCHFWAGSELDERVKRHPDIVAEFFQIAVDRPSTFVHNLPYPSLGDLFKGREAVLDALAADSEPTAIVQPGVIHGLGGIGKTRLAVEHAWRSTERYPDGIFFVAAESPERLRASLAALAVPDLLVLPERRLSEEEEVVGAVLRRLRQRGGWLMILDNADTAEASAAVEALVPRLDRGRVLITSRWTSWGREVREQPLKLLEVEAAYCYLLDAAERRQRRGDDEAEAQRLAKLLGGLPLALEQAAAYVERYRLSFAAYLEEWQAERERVLEWFDERRMHYPAPVAVTWQRTFSRLSPGAQTILRLASQLSPEPIPEGIFEHGKEIVAEAGTALCEELSRKDESVALRDALAELADTSLAGREGGAFTVHPVVQEVVRSRIPAERRREWVAWALEVVNAAAVGDPMDVRTWGVWNPLRPHVERIARAADAEGIGKPTARLIGELGRLLLYKGLFSSAEPLMRRTLEIDEASLGPEHPNVAVDLNNLAMLLKATNRPAQAEPLMRRALEIDVAALGPEHPNVAAHLSNLAALLLAANRLAEAEPLMHRALEIDEASFGPEHPLVAIRLNNLAQLLKATNRPAEAEPLMRRALQIDEATLGPEHPNVAADLSNLAALLAANRPAEAEPLIRRALQIDEAAHGPEHPKVAIRLNNLAQLLQQATGRQAEAEPLMRRALEIDEACFGPEHPNVARDLNNLARLLQVTNRLAEAEPLMRRALRIFETSLDPDHPWTVTARGNLGAMR